MLWVGVDGFLQQAFAEGDIALLDRRQTSRMQQLRALYLRHINDGHLIVALGGAGQHEVVLSRK